MFRIGRSEHKKRPKPEVTELLLKTTLKGDDSTGGVLFVDDEMFCHTLEDEIRDHKVKHETAIPEGRYEVKFRDDTTVGMTAKYRKRFPWFTYHLHLQDVEGFSYIYIHVGNSDDDSSGCILVGKVLKRLEDGNGKLYSSAVTFERLYKLISGRLNKGGQVFITIER